MVRRLIPWLYGRPVPSLHCVTRCSLYSGGVERWSCVKHVHAAGWLLVLQVPCRGRGESPDPVAVNMAVWEIRKSLAAQPNLFILVHCTHGFNRSGALGLLLVAFLRPGKRVSSNLLGYVRPRGC